jgi:G6PDH family F420-dependent oxidoreductase
MTSYGYTLMTEQSGPRELIGHASAAEQAGFDFEVMSDHYFPWLDEMGHSAYAWSVLGAVSQVTDRVELMTYVTCPTIRYHPAVVAQKAATVDLLSDGRFTLGLGAGENLNTSTTRASTSGSTRRSCGTSPSARSRSAWPCRASSRWRRSRHWWTT